MARLRLADANKEILMELYKRTPTELLDLIEAKGKEVAVSLAALRKSI